MIVGARCAGSTLADALAREGLDVLLVDRDTFPSETVSTHLIFPNTLARFEQLGVLDTLRAAHEVPTLDFRIVALGHDIAGGFTPIDGFERCAAPRRSALDKAILDTAIAAGANVRLGTRVVELIGAGTEEDPISGVVLEGGERIAARWVFGADGRASTVASWLDLEKTRPLAGEVSFLFAYWRGIPNDGSAVSAIKANEIVNRWAGEDGTCLLIAWGDQEFTRGASDERMRRYLERLWRFSDVVPARALAEAQMISDLVVAPESLMRGYFRTPSGPGWALLGDACHFKHPATAQGIADAVEQAIYISSALTSADGTLGGYERWRDERAAEQYEWSFTWGAFPRPEAEPLFAGWASEPDAARDLCDCFSRRLVPSQVLTPERLARWYADS